MQGFTYYYYSVRCFVGLGTTLGCGSGCAATGPHQLHIQRYSATRQLVDLLKHIYIFYCVRVRNCISSHTHFFSHTINISNDQTIILDITGGRRRRRLIKWYLFMAGFDRLEGTLSVWLTGYPNPKYPWLINGPKLIERYDHLCNPASKFPRS